MNKVHNEYTDELIDSSRISVVIQGLTHYVEGDDNCLFYQCVNSIKKYLPDAEIIVSTWEGQACDESVVDRVIYGKEPEGLKVSENLTRQWNFNKMVVSTINGLNAINRQYALKIRSDLKLNGLEIFKITKKVGVSDAILQYKIFKEPINVTNIYIKKPLSYHHFLFHLSDITQFGRVDLLQDLWNREIFTREELFCELKWNSCFNYHCDTQERNSPEQALMIGWLNSHGYNIYLPYTTYVSANYLKVSELTLSLNFNVLEWDASGIIFPYRFTFSKNMLNSYIYRASELNLIYTKYNGFYFLKRITVMYLNFYVFKFFNIEFRDEFIRTILFWFSPKLYFKLKKGWRKFKKKDAL